jgi:hypothetical protein
MTRFRVPDRHIGALKYLGSAEVESFDQLLAALADEPASSRAELEERVKRVLPHDDDAPAYRPLIGAIMALCVLRESEDANEFAADIAKADELEFGDAERTTFEQRLARVLELEPLTNLAKAANLISENDKLYGEGRIITDIRPVFPPTDPSGRPSGALILHTLKIDYYKDEEFESAYFVLDDVDLVKLRGAVDRALDKSKSLRELLLSVDLAAMQPLREEGEQGEE